MATPAPLSDLNRRFEISGIAKIVDGRGGLPCVQVTAPRASGEIYLHGAHVTSWKPAGAEEVLYVSSKSKWQDGSAIRGGVPVCFPWFSTRAEDPHSPPHGLVRAKPWQLEGITHADHNVTVAFSSSANDATQKTWFGDYHLLFCATFGEQLRLELIVTNRGTSSFRFEEALHSYFRVGNIEAVRLRGLDGVAYLDKTNAQREKHHRGDVVFSAETDRIYRNTLATVEIEDPANPVAACLSPRKTPAIPLSGIPGPKKRKPCPTWAPTSGANLSAWKPATSAITPSLSLRLRRTP